MSQTLNRTVEIGSPMTSISHYISPSYAQTHTAPVSQYSSVPKDRNQHVIESMVRIDFSVIFVN